jgi:hypothetical protein
VGVGATAQAACVTGAAAAREVGAATTSAKRSFASECQPSSRRPAAASIARAESRVNLYELSVQAHLETQVADADGLGPVGDQVHLDALFRRVVPGVVPERVGPEVGAEAPVDHAQDVAVEAGGDAGGVVVRGLQHRAVLHEVDAEQQPIATPQQATHLRQQGQPRRRVEVADGAPEEEHEPAAAGRGDVDEVLLEIADDRVHLQVGVVGEQARRRGGHGGLVDVDGGVAQRAGAARLQEAARLQREAGAQLDHVARRQRAHERRRQRVEQRVLDAGQVVLGQPRDLVEESGADGIVEVLRRQRARARAQTAQHVVGHGLQARVSIGVDVDPIAHDRLLAPAGPGRRRRSGVVGQTDP